MPAATSLLRLQCLVNVAGLEEAPLARVLTVIVSPEERVATLQARVVAELRATKLQRGADQPHTAMKLYGVPRQRLTYRLNPKRQCEELFLDGVEISDRDASSHVVLDKAQQLVPWARVSWYFLDQPFVLPDAVDVVVAWEENFALV